MVPGDTDMYIYLSIYLFYLVHFWKAKIIFLSALENRRLELRKEAEWNPKDEKTGKNM